MGKRPGALLEEGERLTREEDQLYHEPIESQEKSRHGEKVPEKKRKGNGDVTRRTEKIPVHAKSPIFRFSLHTDHWDDQIHSSPN